MESFLLLLQQNHRHLRNSQLVKQQLFLLSLIKVSIYFAFGKHLITFLLKILNLTFYFFEAVGPNQNPVGNYYAPVAGNPSYGFNHGYTPLQPVSNPPPLNESTGYITQPPPIPGSDTAFYNDQNASKLPTTIQPTAINQPPIGFTAPAAFPQPITSQPMSTGMPLMNYGTPLPGPTGRSGCFSLCNALPNIENLNFI